MNNISEWFEQYIKERDAAVKSLDFVTFKEWVKKERPEKIFYNRLPSDEVLEITMYKMAVNITTIDIETRVRAFRWLLEHGYDFSLD